MKIIVLTTQTTHHTFFVRELNKIFPLQSVVVEKNILKAPYNVYHPFEGLRDSYERKEFFSNTCVTIKDIIKTWEVDSVKDPGLLAYLKNMQPDIIVVFGTQKIPSELIDAFPRRIVNLHGGDPETYRGLDSHLWAIYHKDFESLKSTLHLVNARLDDGDIISQLPLPLYGGMALFELRKANTEVCLELTIEACHMYFRQKHFSSSPQAQKGRYYSFMPTALKDICQRNFQLYIDNFHAINQ